MIRNTPKHTIPIENWEIELKLSQINTNLGELGFLDLPQTIRWKRRFYPEDHVFEVGFEFGSFNIIGSRVLSPNPRSEKELAWERKKTREMG
jgi:hypothetical protein